MSVEVDELFVSAQGLQLPWVVQDFKLDNVKRRIYFQTRSKELMLTYPACRSDAQPVHDWLARWAHNQDFLQFEAWLHCDVPRVAASEYGKISLTSLQWSRIGSGSTAAIEALALALCSELPRRQAAISLRCQNNQFWRHIEFQVNHARAQEVIDSYHFVGIDVTSLRRGQNYLTVVDDLDADRLLFAGVGRTHKSVPELSAHLKARGGAPAAVKHVCIDMSAARAALALSNALISNDFVPNFSGAIEAMDCVRRAESDHDARAALSALSGSGPKMLMRLQWGMRRIQAGWSRHQLNAIRCLQHSTLLSARDWRLMVALRDLCARAQAHNNDHQAANDIKAWPDLALSCRFEQFKKLGTAHKGRLNTGMRGSSITEVSHMWKP